MKMKEKQWKDPMNKTQQNFKTKWERSFDYSESPDLTSPIILQKKNNRSH